jgi:NADH-quinone oxidoreductase subunit J
MTVTTVLFYLFAAIVVVAAYRVVTARSPVTAAMHLVLVFFTSAMLWMLINAEFLALLLVLVYVGAVMVLFLFVVMMLDITVAEAKATARSYLPLGLMVAAVMVLEMSFVLVHAWWDPSAPLPVPPSDYNNAAAIGTAMYTEYVYGVEIGAVLLLVGMVAAIALTLRRRSDYKRNVVADQLRVRPADRLRMVKNMNAQSAGAGVEAGKSQDATAPAADNGAKP